MKKLILLFVVIPLLSNAQDAEKKVAAKNISIGFSFSPDYSFRTLRNNDGSSSSTAVIEARNSLEAPKIGFTTGFNLNIKCSGKLEIQTGILYSNKGYRTPLQNIYSPGGAAALQQYKSKFRFNYLEVPLKLNVVAGKDKIKYVAGAGLAAGIFLNASTKTILIYSDRREEKRKQTSSEDYKNFNLLALASTGVEYRLNENIFLRTETIFRYGFLKIIDMPVTAKLWNIGAINMGIYINLK